MINKKSTLIKKGKRNKYFLKTKLRKRPMNDNCVCIYEKDLIVSKETHNHTIYCICM